MAIDRDATLRKAEKLLRQGRLDSAIAEYLKVVQEQPKDWSTVNAVGDLLVRAGQVESGIEHYTRIADHFFEEGFLPRAAAVYKKILKLKPDDEHSALRGAEISEKQGLLADAKAALAHVAERRLRRGDKRGAAEIHLQLGSLDPTDLGTSISAALAAAELGDVAGAVQRLLQLAGDLQRKSKPAEALQALDEAVKLDPQNREVRTELVARFMETGELERAAGYASTAQEFKAIATEYYARGKGDDALQVLEWALEKDRDDVETRRQLVKSYLGRSDFDRAAAIIPEDSGDPDLLLALAEIHFRSGRAEQGRELAARALSLDSHRREELVLLACRLCDSDPEGAFACVDAATDAALAENDWAAAASALQEYVTRIPGHVPALMKLVEVCVDGGLEATMYSAQAQLADAYLKDGKANEARVIAEDLVAREPWEAVNIERFRSALVLLGEPDPDSVIADRLSGDSPFTSTDLTLDFSFNELAQPSDQPKQAEQDEKEGQPAKDGRQTGPAAIDLAGILGDDARGPEAPSDTFEIDLSDTFGETAGHGAAPRAGGGLAGLERAFEGFREEAARQGTQGAAAQLKEAQKLRESGDTDGAIALLRRVTRSPRHRFRAAAELAKIHKDAGQTHEAIEWLERAAESAPAASDESRGLLYDLGLLLAETGEKERALAVFLELQADAPDYRDVPRIIGRLSQKA